MPRVTRVYIIEETPTFSYTSLGNNLITRSKLRLIAPSFLACRQFFSFEMTSITLILI